MKQIIAIYFLSVLTFNLMGQNNPSPSGTCNDPKIFCYEYFRGKIDLNDDVPCVNGNSKLFFKIIISIGVNVTNMNGAYSVFSGGTSISSNYILYGPFNPDINTCEKISTFQAPIAAQGSGAGFIDFPAMSFITGKVYILEINVSGCKGTISSSFVESYNRHLSCLDKKETPCESCLPKFQPSIGEYVVSAWVRSESVLIGHHDNQSDFNAPKIAILAGPSPTNLTGPSVVQTFGVSGNIIDGWQKIEGKFFVTDATSFELSLKTNNGYNSYFDDIRIYPNDGSAITYVYDPLTLRLMAQLDERNYATLYEYDEEGKLIRIKKETEKGIMTIQENRDNNSLK